VLIGSLQDFSLQNFVLRNSEDGEKPYAAHKIEFRNK
jgi:hypothetical protein